MTNERFLVVFCTCPGAEAAARLAQRLVEDGLAACVNVLPAVRSIYVWEGALQREDEALLIIKTTAARLPELEARIVELHPYAVPEVIAVPVEGGHAPYLQWLAAATRAPGHAAEPPAVVDPLTAAGPLAGGA